MYFVSPATHGAVGCSLKSFTLLWRCKKYLFGFLDCDHLPRLCRKSANKGDNEMILGSIHRSPGICLIVKGNPRKNELGDLR